MKICKKCGDEFPDRIEIDGKVRVIHKRVFCLKCSPFQKHNTCQYIAKEGFKVCTKCQEEIPIDQFSKKTEFRIHSWCNKCLYNCQSERDHERKEKAIQYKGGKCIKCGYNKYIGALEFHHRNPEEKDDDFTKLRKRKWETHKAELDKCDLLCSNCHKEVHNDIEQLRRANF